MYRAQVNNIPVLSFTLPSKRASILSHDETFCVAENLVLVVEYRLECLEFVNHSLFLAGGSGHTVLD